MESYKIIIIGPKHTNKMGLAQELISINDDLEVCPTYTTELEFKDKVTDEFFTYMSNEDVKLGYKNNSFIYVTSYNEYSKGMLHSDLYNKDIFVLDFLDFNNMSERMLNEFNNKLFIWLDTKEKNKDIEDLEESKFSYERSLNSPLLYFVDENIEDIAKIVLRYIDTNCSEKERQEIIEQNS